MASIQKRTRNGRTTYRVQYRDPSGAMRGKVFALRREAEAWLAENAVATAKGAWVDPRGGRVLFGEQAERWFATTAALKPSTRRVYRQLLDNQILPTLGAGPLAAIDALQVRELLARLSRDGLSTSRIRNAFNTISQVLNSAVESGNLARNVATGIKTPKRQRREMLFLTADQVEVLADAVDLRYRALVLTAAYSGMRAGELAALRVGRLDLLRGTVRVVESATEVGGELVWGAPKTYEARTVPLPRFLVAELAAHLADRPHGPDDLVFTTAEGGPLRQGTWTARYFKPALRRAGLQVELRFHDLRHSAASIAIASGASVKAVQKMLGHASATMTLDTYSHLWPDELESLADRLDQVREHAASGTVAQSANRSPVEAPGAEVVPITAGQRG